MILAAVVCVRMTSSRLPGKALCVYDQFSGKPNLGCIIDRVKTSRHNPRIVVATSTEKSDDPIVDWCTKNGTDYVRGDLNNVVKRFDQALLFSSPDADLVWRVMSDNPLIDVGLVDQRIDIMQRYNADVVVPIMEPTYAAHSNIWSREAWDYCAKMSSGSLLEHPGEMIYENLHEFRAVRDPGPEAVYYQDIRTELDTPEDLQFFAKVFNDWQLFFDEKDVYNINLMNVANVLRWLADCPNITAINHSISAKTSTTYLHGHHRARNVLCKSCGYTVANLVNERLDIPCARCGQVRQFHI